MAVSVSQSPHFDDRTDISWNGLPVPLRKAPLIDSAYKAKYTVTNALAGCPILAYLPLLLFYSSLVQCLLAGALNIYTVLTTLPLKLEATRAVMVIRIPLSMAGKVGTFDDASILDS